MIEAPNTQCRLHFLHSFVWDLQIFQCSNHIFNKKYEIVDDIISTCKNHTLILQQKAEQILLFAFKLKLPSAHIH